MRFVILAWLLSISALNAGCAPVAAYQSDPAATAQLRQRARECLKRGISYEYLPSVRIAAIESMQQVWPQDGRPWIRTRLIDSHPAVRFAACMALGALRDKTSRQSFLTLLEDPDRNVQVAAIYALHRLGDTSRTAQLADYLFSETALPVRRNAALALGRLGETGAIRLLAKLVNHQDAGLHLQALESLALLGNDEALQQLTFVANSGEGPQEVMAINALAETKHERFANTFRFKLSEGAFPETRLAAARALGRLGSAEGLDVALDGIGFDQPKNGFDQDPPEVQILRVRQMAALALGDIGDPAGLDALTERMEDNSDPRVQVAAAKAILQIIDSQEQGRRPSRAR